MIVVSTLLTQSLTGPGCSVRMLRDRYRKWGINDKNARPHRVAVATSSFTTQTALLHSPRIVELNEDESPVAQEPASTRTEHDLFNLRMVASELRPGSPRAALLSLDPKLHEILNGLSYWCNGAPSFDPVILLPTFLSRRRLETSRTRSSRKSALGQDCYEATSSMTRSRSRDLWSVFGMIELFSEYQYRDWIDWLEGRPFEQCRMLWLCCELVVQKLGPQHPVTLICSWAARGLPFEDLTSISEGLFRLHVSRLSLLRPPHWLYLLNCRELLLEDYIRVAMHNQESRLQAVAVKSA
jgi:hypothetical protein